MKIIELLNKIANGEEVPKKIKYKITKRTYNKEDKDYTRDDGELGSYYLFQCINSLHLNDEIEIIEDKEIEKLENEIEFYSYSRYEELKNDIDKVLYILKAINLTENKINNLNNKLNELIDKVNSLEKNQ